MPGWWTSTTRSVISTRPAAWVLSHTGHHLDRLAMAATGGQRTASSVLVGLPVGMLTCVGRKSGQLRTVPLVGIADGDRMVLIASNWGKGRHPAWYSNLMTNPACSFTLDGQTQQFTAYEATGAERDMLWQKAVTLYPGYAAYARRTDGRTIPVVVLEQRLGDW